MTQARYMFTRIRLDPALPFIVLLAVLLGFAYYIIAPKHQTSSCDSWNRYAYAQLLAIWDAYTYSSQVSGRTSATGNRGEHRRHVSGIDVPNRSTVPIFDDSDMTRQLWRPMLGAWVRVPNSLCSRTHSEDIIAVVQPCATSPDNTLILRRNGRIERVSYDMLRDDAMSEYFGGVVPRLVP